jgi:hypothetical protein
MFWTIRLFALSTLPTPEFSIGLQALTFPRVVKVRESVDWYDV